MRHSFDQEAVGPDTYEGLILENKAYEEVENSKVKKKTITIV